ncbi:hypothetical protein [Leptospira levettii]|uniref:Uncharacterized protein n=1 Tax=Leptospira levettii TaxID=2023178 RepID=A0ABY2MTW7_9LEPT|nr:hypothetical protein [Leptospira levettii]MCW7467522.1 hypothetical protein [Leptospira levettii]TGL75397.1 hypothetical protein EHQ60_00300 [Leptospira levettii]
MVEFLSSAIPQAITSTIYIGAVIIVSQAVFRFIPIKAVLLHKKRMVFIIATLIAIPPNILYWITAPENFQYCVEFSFVQDPICNELPGWILSLYQSAFLFLSYLLSQFLYDKLARKMFEKVGFVPKQIDEEIQ